MIIKKSVLIVILVLFFLSSFSQKLNYNFKNTNLSNKEFNTVKLFFKYGHSLPVMTTRISPNSKVLATLDLGGNIIIWDIDSRTQIMSINGVEYKISNILFTPDGKYLVGTGRKTKSIFKNDYYLFYWDYFTGKIAFKRKLDDPIYSMRISPDYTKIYTIGNKSGIQVRDIRTGEIINKLKLGLTTGSTFAISNDEKYLIFGNTSSAAKLGKMVGAAITGSDKEGFIQIRDFKTGKNLKEFYVGKSSRYDFLQDVLFTSDNKIIIIGNFAQANFYVFDLIKMKAKKIKAKVPMQIRTVEQSADGKYFYVSTNQKLIKINAVTFQQIEAYPITDYIRSINFSKNGEFFITGGGNAETGENAIRVWDYKTDKQLEEFQGKVAKIISTTITPQTKDLIVGTNDGQAQVISLTTGEIKKTLNVGYEYVGVKVTKNGKYLVTSSTGRTQMLSLFKFHTPAVIKIWNAVTYELIDSIPDYNQFIISQDDKYVFVMKGGRMKTIEFKTGKIISEKKITGSFTPIAFNNDGTQILTMARGTFKIRDAKTFKKLVVGKKLKNYRGHLNSVTYNYDQSKILGVLSNYSKNNGALIEWNQDGKINKVIYKNDNAMVWNAVFNNNKTKVLCGLRYRDLTGEVVKIDIKTGEAIDSTKNVGFPLEYTSDEKNVLSYTDNYRKGITISDANTFETKLKYLKVRDADGYALYTDDYYYKITKNARVAISFLKSGIVYPFEQFDLKFNRPDIIASKMPYPDKQLIEMYNKAYKKRLQKMGLTEESLKMDFNLPEIKITNKDKLLISSDIKSITININAKGNKSKLQNLKVWVNDVPLYGSKGFDLSNLNTESLKKDINIELSEGKNKIQVAILNDKGVESLKDTKYIEYTGRETKHDLYIVAIGVSKYTDNQYNLNYAAKDVTDFIQLMQSQTDVYNHINTYQFIDTNATVENIMSVKENLKKTNVDDQVIVYFAGHGLLNKDLDYFLAMNNVDFNKPEINGLSIGDFESLVDSIPSRKKSMFIDACHSGEVDKDEILNIKEAVEQSDSPVVFRGGGISNNSKISRNNSDLKNSFELMKETFSDLRRGSGAVIISSAGGGEFALESDKWKNGVFTLSVIDGLKNKKADLNNDNQVSIMELGDYVSNNVTQLTFGQQNPTFRRENLEFDYAFLNPKNTMINIEQEIVGVTRSDPHNNLSNTTTPLGIQNNTNKPQISKQVKLKDKWDLKDITEVDDSTYFLLKDLTYDELRYYKYRTVRKAVKRSGLKAKEISHDLGKLHRRRVWSTITFFIPQVNIVMLPTTMFFRMLKHKSSKKKGIDYRAKTYNKDTIVAFYNDPKVYLTIGYRNAVGMLGKTIEEGGWGGTSGFGHNLGMQIPAFRKFFKNKKNLNGGFDFAATYSGVIMYWDMNYTDIGEDYNGDPVLVKHTDYKKNIFNSALPFFESKEFIVLGGNFGGFLSYNISNTKIYIDLIYKLGFSYLWFDYDVYDASGIAFRKYLSTNIRFNKFFVNLSYEWGNTFNTTIDGYNSSYYNEKIPTGMFGVSVGLMF